MKLSNLVLSVVAFFMLGLAVGSASLTMTRSPTAVINVPMNASTKGSGFSIILPNDLTIKQKAILTMAYTIAKKDGHKYPQLLQGILLRETNAGGIKSYKVAGNEYGLKPNERYYGLAQLKLSATRDVLAKWPTMWNKFDFQGHTDEEVIAKLIENDEFNIAIASKYILILQTMGYTTPMSIATAYNKGPGGASNVDYNEDEYAKGVANHIKKLQPKT